MRSICSYLEGVQVDFQRLSEWTTFEVIEDYQDLISRYNLFEAYVQQGKNSCKENKPKMAYSHNAFTRKRERETSQRETKERQDIEL